MEIKRPLIAPSILSADFSKLGEEVQAVEKSGADWLHIDVMDGCFVPNITIGPLVVSAIRPLTGLFFDVHLMIDDPLKYADPFIDAGSDMITFHMEACKDPGAIIRRVKAREKMVGVSIKPGTDDSVLDPVLGEVDMVLVMTVEPGFGGQSFMDDMMDKVRNIRKRYEGYIQVDGGVNRDKAAVAVDAGADILVAGTAVFGKDDYSKAIADLKG